MNSIDSSESVPDTIADGAWLVETSSFDARVFARDGVVRSVTVESWIVAAGEHRGQKVKVSERFRINRSADPRKMVGQSGDDAAKWLACRFHTVGLVCLEDWRVSEGDAEQPVLGGRPPPSRPQSVDPKASGYTGDSCHECNSTRMIRAGTCLVCLDCQKTTGGCS